MKYNSVKVNGLNIFYRESGNVNKPNFLLLHGFPTSSHMFRNLMPMLENDFHVIAPDYIGFGQSEAPLHDDFNYTFENLTNYIDEFFNVMNINNFYMYIFDYGAPIGLELAVRHPDKVMGIVSQNGNIYNEGLGPKWADRKKYWENPTTELREAYKSAFDPETIINQYTTGELPGSISPDGYSLDIFYSKSRDYPERQSDLIFDYQNNVKNYPKFQKYIKNYKPEILVTWGKNDPSFITPGALAFEKDNPNTETHLLDGGHFVLESHWKEIGTLILNKWS
ncbi:alpha/beta fold hydrolase [Lactobacillus terrae]|uniref:alpha/beta fold hydrolase n=1 Tax=Lactobacillus terrae TaxID=2269374 RepID=UPI000C1B664F|nr:alpha/beta fold hydrolase [Lactobacillus terrae]